MVYQNRPLFCQEKFTSLYRAGMIQSILFMLISSMDALLAGHFLGEAAVSAVQVPQPMALVFMFLIQIFVAGCRILYAEEIGRYDQKKANDYFSTALTIALALSALLFLFILIASEATLHIYHLSDDVYVLAKEYLRYYKYVYIFSPLISFLGAMVYCDGDTKTSVLATVLYTLTNFLLSILGVIYLGMAGISLGTVVSGSVSLVIYCSHFFRKEGSLRYHLHFSFRELTKLVKYSLKDSTYTLAAGLGGILTTRFICGRFGSAYLSVYVVINFALGFTGLYSGLAESMLVLFNTYRGEKNRDGVLKTLRVTFRGVCQVSAALTLVFCLAAPLIARSFSLQSPELFSSAVFGIRVVSLTFCFIGLMDILTAYYNAQGKVVMSTFLARCKDSFFSIGMLILLESILGAWGMWLGLMLSPVVAFLLSLVVLLLRFGKRMFFCFQRMRGKAPAGILWWTPAASWSFVTAPGNT